jgi:AraC-like DNA-binding protein
MAADFSISVRFYRLSKALQPYFTALYLFDIDCPNGSLVEDYLHPEWAAMRFTHGVVPNACFGPGAPVPQWPFVVSGPNSKSIHFGVSTARIWGLGLMPAGWARFVDGRARDFADRTVDGAVGEAFRVFAPIFGLTRDVTAPPDTIGRKINAYLLQHLDRSSPHEAQILACHQALRDPEVANVADLAERLDLTARSLERLCGRYFGFPPKLLLRRQRFLRSLAQFMLDPQRTWSEAIDGQYYDQAQFVRDFRSFMSMTPSAYADMSHPIMEKIIAHRMADQGAAPQTDLPTILRYTKDLHGEND